METIFLCKRKGLSECVLPDSITLTDDQLQIFLEKIVTSEHSCRILDELIAKTAASIEPHTVESKSENTPGEYSYKTSETETD